jgi:cardiolipin synthase
VHTLIDLLSDLSWGPRTWTLLVLVAELVALATVPSVLLTRRGRPVASLGWVLTLITLPILGVVAWWGVGRSHLDRKRRRRGSARADFLRSMGELRADTPDTGPLAPLPLVRLPESLADDVFPPVPGNRVTVLLDGAQTYDTIECLIREARHHVHLLFYTFRPDAVGRRFRDLLVQRARNGVEVRLLCDALGSFLLPSRFLDPLKAAGGRVDFFGRPRLLRRSLTVNFRNHRKIVVTDGVAAYLGGLNIGNEYTGEWRDLGLLLRGPVAGQAQEVFADDWFYTTGENLATPDYIAPAGANRQVGCQPEPGENVTCMLIAGGPDNVHSITHDAFFIAINQARRRIFLTTPYLAPGPAILAALRAAALRGVDVRLIVPRRSDVPVASAAGRSFFPDIIAAGVRVFEYLPAPLHGKMWVFDDDLAVIGSANLDTRSFRLNFEVSCFLHAGTTNRTLTSIFAAYQADSEEVSLQQLEGRSLSVRLQEAALHLLSPLL